uniref:Phage major capsid protein E n=1 Tax=Candidatus Kentrum sp. UNK TaxID=2126344 RepID=A0A450ZWS3_9GAMM|nr:MAG: hypothetical protein BECKUNK1418G_GA0071005_100243 [Candidatus Kentron sp. UNK]VFK68309.1 MAG: hypothetical protein BECKUNK1418H_GA0071006_100143 [Candidatus Kentron sp. UNK]
MSLWQEYQCASMALNEGNYDNDHKVNLVAAKWSDDANDPGKDVDTAREEVRLSTGGQMPNVLMLSHAALLAVKNNANVLEVFKRQNAGSTPSDDYIKNYFQVERLVIGTAAYKNNQDALIPIWGNDAWLGYVAKPKGKGGDISDKVEPSFAYRYHIRKHPFIRKPYEVPNRTATAYQRRDDYRHIISWPGAGYLLQNVV